MHDEWPPRTPVFYGLARCVSCLRLIPPRRGGTIPSIGTCCSATGGGQRDWQGFDMDDSYSVLVCGLGLEFILKARFVGIADKKVLHGKLG